MHCRNLSIQLGIDSYSADKAGSFLHQFRRMSACEQGALHASLPHLRITGSPMRINKRATDPAVTPTSRPSEAGVIGACSAALARMAANLRAIGSARVPGDRTVDRTGEPLARSRTSPQLSKLTAVVETAAQHVERAEHCHRSAGIRIDAALYELDQLRMELQTVVDPALLQGTSRILDAEIAGAQPASEPTKVGPAGSARSAA